MSCMGMEDKKLPSWESELIFKHCRPAARGLLVVFITNSILHGLFHLSVWVAGDTSGFVIIKATKEKPASKDSRFKCEVW